MAKKIFAQIALAIFINILILPVSPVSFAEGPITHEGAPAALLPAPPEESAPAPVATPAEELTTVANPFTDLKPCINKYKKNENGELFPTIENPEPGDDNGYLITIIEEPFNVESKGETPVDNYVVRACFRNTFQYYSPDKKSLVSEATLAAFCSEKAQDLLEDESLKKYRIKYSCKEVMVILTKGGTTAIHGYINLIYRWGAGMVGIIAVTIIILSGIQISASGGDSEAIGSAKKRIIQSIAGIVVLFLSSLILYTINPNFFTAR